MSFDYMHCVLLGVVRMLLKLWFTTSYHRNPWYLGKVVKQIDDICCKIRPPDEITRTLRSIESTLKYWKGYYQHHLLLVEGMYLLLRDVITKDDITQSEKLLKHYCFLFPALYDEWYVTLNMHGLLHLPEVVENLGPLWAHSCFPFESANGDLLKYFHGSSGVEKQVIDHISTIQTLPSVAHILDYESKVEDLYFQMSAETYAYRNCDIIEPGYCVHGENTLAVSLSEEELDLFSKASITLPAICSASQYKSLHLISYNRIIKTQISSKSALKDNSGVVFLSSDGTICYEKLHKLLVFRNNTI